MRTLTIAALMLAGLTAACAHQPRTASTDSATLLAQTPPPPYDQNPAAVTGAPTDTAAAEPAATPSAPDTETLRAGERG